MADAPDPYTDLEPEEKPYDRALFMRLLRYLKPYRREVIWSVVLLLVAAGTNLVGPLLIQIGIDDGFARLGADMPEEIRDEASQVLTFVAVAFGALLIGSVFLNYFKIYIMHRYGQKVLRDIRVEVFAHLQRLSLGFYDRHPVGRLVTRVTSDVEALNELFTSGAAIIFNDLLLIIAIVVAMAVLNFKLTLVTLAVLPLLIWVSIKFRNGARVAFRKMRAAVSRLNAHMQEHVSGVNIIQLFSREKQVGERFRQVNDSHQVAALETVRNYALFFPMVEFMAGLASAALLWQGGIMLLDPAENLTFGAFAAFTIFAAKLFAPIRELAEKYNVLQSAMASSERIFEIMDAKPLVATRPDATPLPTLRGEIEFENVWFAYRGEDWILKDVSFKVGVGESVALVGHTGAGKSTIIKLIARHYDVQKGTIRIDGHDIRDIRLEDLRRRLGVVLQEVFLFSGSVERNIGLGRVNPEKVQAAARAVNAETFIEKLPEKYATDVKERGVTLSAGQRQLLAFARALAAEPHQLMLDEATSNIDTDTELLIQDALEVMLRGRTSVIVAHRLSTIKKCDRILVFHKGVIREQGSHESLLEQDGIYRRLYELQYRQQEAAAPKAG